MMTNLLDAQVELTDSDAGGPEAGRVRGAWVSPEHGPRLLLECVAGELVEVAAGDYHVVGRWLAKNDGRQLTEVLCPRGEPVPLTGGPVLAVPRPRG